MYFDAFVFYIKVHVYLTFNQQQFVANILIIRGKPKPSSVCCMKKREHWVFLSFHVFVQIVWVRMCSPNKSSR